MQRYRGMPTILGADCCSGRPAFARIGAPFSVAVVIAAGRSVRTRRSGRLHGGGFDSTRQSVEDLALSGNPRAATIISALQNGAPVFHARPALFIKQRRRLVDATHRRAAAVARSSGSSRCV